MIIPDYRPGLILAHSAKGSSWKKHKYIKIVDGLYFYPNDYVGGRHVKNAKNTKSKKKKEKEDTSKKGASKDTDDKKKDSKTSSTSKEIEKLANDVIYGKYGVGQERMKKLGNKYDAVQYEVNKKLLGNDRAKAIYDRSKAQRQAAYAASKKKTSSTKTSKSSSTSTKKKKTKTSSKKK